MLVVDMDDGDDQIEVVVAAVADAAAAVTVIASLSGTLRLVRPSY